MAKLQKRMARLSEENRKYLERMKQKNDLRSLDEAFTEMRKIFENNLANKKKKLRVYKELELW